MDTDTDLGPSLGVTRIGPGGRSLVTGPCTKDDPCEQPCMGSTPDCPYTEPRLKPAPLKQYPYPETSDLARALNVVGEKWTLLIVQALQAGERRPVELQREAVAGISNETLRMCLRRMTEAGLVTRTRYRELPPRVMYELTPRGRALVPALRALSFWAHEWLSPVGGDAA